MRLKFNFKCQLSILNLPDTVDEVLKVYLWGFPARPETGYLVLVDTVHYSGVGFIFRYSAVCTVSSIRSSLLFIGWSYIFTWFDIYLLNQDFENLRESYVSEFHDYRYLFES